MKVTGAIESPKPKQSDWLDYSIFQPKEGEECWSSIKGEKGYAKTVYNKGKFESSLQLSPTVDNFFICYICRCMMMSVS